MLSGTKPSTRDTKQVKEFKATIRELLTPAMFFSNESSRLTLLTKIRYAHELTPLEAIGCLAEEDRSFSFDNSNLGIIIAREDDFSTCCFYLDWLKNLIVDPITARAVYYLLYPGMKRHNFGTELAARTDDVSILIGDYYFPILDQLQKHSIPHKEIRQLLLVRNSTRQSIADILATKQPPIDINALLTRYPEINPNLPADWENISEEETIENESAAARVESTPGILTRFIQGITGYSDILAPPTTTSNQPQQPIPQVRHNLP